MQSKQLQGERTDGQFQLLMTLRQMRERGKIVGSLNYYISTWGYAYLFITLARGVG